MKNKEGFAPIIILVLITIAILIVIFLPKPKTIPTLSPKPSPTSCIATPTSTPIPIPTLTPTIKPSPKPTSPVISGPPEVGYSSTTVHTEKGDFGAQILSIDLNTSRMITDTANDSDCTSNCSVMSLQDFVKQKRWLCWSQWNLFFVLLEPAYSSCGQNNSFDFPVWNSRLGHWINGGNLGWNSRSIFYTYLEGGANYND